MRISAFFKILNKVREEDLRTYTYLPLCKVRSKKKMEIRYYIFRSMLSNNEPSMNLCNLLLRRRYKNRYDRQQIKKQTKSNKN